MKDYRLPENRRQYFDALYRMNLQHCVMPGLVYLYMPELARQYNWDAEQKLWFAYLNGMTQNPITSLRLFEQLPVVPPATAALTKFTDWFNAEWDTLQFDTDRRYQKRDTIQAIKNYALLVAEHGTQVKMLTGTYAELWELVRNRYYSFGRLSSFSYLEYVKIMGYGADCDDLLFNDKSGSKSHRNGMLFLLGKDELVWDKRLLNGQDGNYPEFGKMCGWLTQKTGEYLDTCGVPGASRFTFESNLCTFKNHFFGRRYPGVYADMAQERIEWADARGQSAYTAVFKDMRTALPDWLRVECGGEQLTINQKAAVFPETGVPYRAEHFL
jgi:hypothetical protein